MQGMSATDFFLCDKSAWGLGECERVNVDGTINAGVGGWQLGLYQALQLHICTGMSSSSHWLEA